MVQNNSSEVILLLGSNIGDRTDWLSKATESIANKLGVITQCSSIYESEPWGFDADQPFLNQAVKVRSSLGPRSILHAIWEIEKSLGREREKSRSYTSRTIDIDILTWESRIFWTRKLQVPHIQMQNRRFALTPLVELAGENTHPVLDLTYKTLLSICPDQTWVKPFVPSHV